MSRDWQKELTAAARRNSGEVMQLWQQCRQSESAQDLALDFAAVFSRMLQYEAAIKVLEVLGEGLPAQQQRALLMGKMGRVDEAIAILEGLTEGGHRDAETLGLLGGRYKDRAMAAGGSGPDLQRAYFTYLDAYEETGDSYPGINAASLALEAGEADESRRIAGEIVAALEAVPRSQLDHWQFATLGEGQLLLGDLAQARRWYGRAVAATPNAVENIARMRGQARRNLERLNQPRDALDDILTVKRVAAFTGHMIDTADRAQPRFPADRVGEVRAAIRHRLKEHDVGRGVSSAAAGSDLLFLEELLNRGGSAEVFLPFPASEFKETSVGGWEDAFDEVLAHPNVNLTVLAEAKPPEDRLAEAFASCNRRIIEQAQSVARLLDEEPLLIAVWDGGPGDDAGGTAETVASWRALALPEDIVELSGSGKSPGPSGKTRGVKVAQPRAKRPRSLYANRYCLAVGIEQYPGGMWRSLANTGNDAKKLCEVLESSYSFETRLLLNGDATKQNIGATMQDEFGDKVTADDLFVLYFAGHGHTIDRKGQAHGFLVPFDAQEETRSTMIPMDDLVSWSSWLECRHLLYIFDSCFSGLIALGGGSGGRVAQDQSVAAMAITAGQADEPVLDGGGDGHSIFTQYLLDTLQGGGDHDRISVFGLYDAVQQRVREFTSQQTPILGSLPNHQGGIIELERFA